MDYDKLIELVKLDLTEDKLDSLKELLTSSEQGPDCEQLSTEMVEETLVKINAILKGGELLDVALRLEGNERLLMTALLYHNVVLLQNYGQEARQ